MRTTSTPTPYRYIQSYYGHTFRPGDRVKFTEGRGRFGVVKQPNGDPQYVDVKFDDGHTGPCHPDSLEIQSAI